MVVSNALSPVWDLLKDAVARAKPPRSGGLGEMLYKNWYLGLTSFGGPAVHFQIVCHDPIPFCIPRFMSDQQFRRLFVEKLEWIDDQVVRAGPRRWTIPP